jgi:L-aspartate oxidase
MSASVLPRGARYDAVVVGGGLAGMLTALALEPARVALLSAAPLGEETSSAWAQGGIAAALGSDDAPALHAADTVTAGAGLVVRDVADRLTADAPRAIQHLVEIGARFDRDSDGGFALGREAAHSRRRIARAGGDATGAELVRAARAATLAASWIDRFENVRATDLLADIEGESALATRRIAGVVALGADHRAFALYADAVVLATGGIGGLYRFTTNPRASIGAGIALAARVGARLADLEFVQFHPTALDVPSDPLPLVSEALRGEGALLIDEGGQRIMAGIDPLLELAPRDVVARGVFAVGAAGGRAFLDARALREEIASRFPTVFAHCMRFGIDPRLAPIPVVAAAHYHMGGIAVDLAGRTSVRGLYACGESASTGVHGANRLASNSLLEAAVYPERIARAIEAERAGVRAAAHEPVAFDERGHALGLGAALAAASSSRDANARDWDDLRATMYRDVGVERDGEGLSRAIDALAATETAARAQGALDLRDAAFVGGAIAHAALARRETRGSHARRDFPELGLGEAQRSFLTISELRPRARRAS